MTTLRLKCYKALVFRDPPDWGFVSVLKNDFWDKIRGFCPVVFVDGP